MSSPASLFTCRVCAIARGLALPWRRWLIILENPDAAEAVDQIHRRLPFFLPGWKVRVSGLGGRAPALSPSQLRIAARRRVPVLYAGQQDMQAAPPELRDNPCYWLNPYLNCREAWEWFELVHQQTRRKPDLAQAQRRFHAFVAQHQLKRLPRAYVFGTGPSLARAADRSWEDGVRIVCNTIVRDRALWHHIRPHFIVAADAGYHFSFAQHARAFRADLLARLRETDTLFLYPAQFDSVVRRELGERASQLVPVLQGESQSLLVDPTRAFAFPQLHNILPRMLSIACCLADEIGLWGFDGRAPKATGFWANSSKQSYPEYMDELRTAFPAFFEALVPERDQTRYMRSAFGDDLERCLSEAEGVGKRLIMLHPTWTDTLRRRCPPEWRGLPDEFGTADEDRRASGAKGPT